MAKNKPPAHSREADDFGLRCGSGAMLTAKELRFKARNCLELADRTNKVYTKEALKSLAQRLNRDARQAERRERDLANYPRLQPSA
jgi:hypothetical protein